MATQMLEELGHYAKTEVPVLTVLPESAFPGGITLDVIRGNSRPGEVGQEQQRMATWLLECTSRAPSAAQMTPREIKAKIPPNLFL